MKTITLKLGLILATINSATAHATEFPQLCSVSASSRFEGVETLSVFLISKEPATKVSSQRPQPNTDQELFLYPFFLKGRSLSYLGLKIAPLSEYEPAYTNVNTPFTHFFVNESSPFSAEIREGNDFSYCGIAPNARFPKGQEGSDFRTHWPCVLKLGFKVDLVMMRSKP